MYLYEILIRLTSNGIQGAHYIQAVDQTDPFTGQSSQVIGPAQPIDLETELDGYLSQALTTALAHNTALQAQVASLQAQLNGE